MLLIDGVRYELWTPPSEDEFEQVAKEHTQEIFGEQSIYIDRKQKLKSLSGIGSIPDGYVIILGTVPQWHIVEAELSSHPLDQHIVAQVSRFITGIKNPNTQRDIVGAMYNEVTKNGYLKLKVEEAIKPTEIYKYLSDLISKPPILTIIIEKDTEGLREAISTLAHSGIKVVEFQTFIREGASLPVHAHLFEPLYEVNKKDDSHEGKEVKVKDKRREKKEGAKAGRVTFAELVNAGLLKDGQVLCFYNTRPFTDERAQVIVSSDTLKYEKDGHIYSKSDLSSILLTQYGFRHGDYPVQGPKFWITEDGKLLDDLNEQIRMQRGERG